MRSPSQTCSSTKASPLTRNASVSGRRANSPGTPEAEASSASTRSRGAPADAAPGNTTVSGSIMGTY